MWLVLRPAGELHIHLHLSALGGGPQKLLASVLTLMGANEQRSHVFFPSFFFCPFIKGSSHWVEVSILHTALQFHRQRNRCCAVSSHDYKFHQTFSIKISFFSCCFVLFFFSSNHLDCFGGKLFLTSRARSICFILLPSAHEEAKVTRATSGMPLFLSLILS